MNSLISFCAIVAVASAGTPEVYQLSPESLTKMHNIALPCTEEFNVDSTMIRKLGDDTLPRDDATNKFLHCFAVKSGLVDKDGHLVAERIAGIVGNHPLVEDTKAAVKKCNEVTKEDPVATTVAMHVCYAENFPIRFVF